MIEKASTCIFVTFACLLMIGTCAWLGKNTQPMQKGIKSYVMANQRVPSSVHL